MTSLIIPVFNEAPFLRRCLDSVRDQTEPFDEVIIIDDGSTDDSPNICEEYRQEGWKIYHTENHGLGGARNLGMLYAAGDWIAFLDSDDRLFSTAHATMREAAHAHPMADIIQFEHVRIVSGPQPHLGNERRTYDIKDGIKGLPYYWFYAWNKLYDAEIATKLPFNDLRFGEDEAYNLELLLNGCEIQCVPAHTVLKHFDNANSLCHIKTMAELKAQDLALLMLEKRYPDYIETIEELRNDHHNSTTYKKMGWKS